MSRQLNPSQVWSQTPLASRTASVIKSIQQGTISLPNGNGTGTATITSVTTGKSMVTLSGLTSADNNTTYPSARMARVDLTNATTVTMTRATSVDGLIAGYQVVEYY